MIAISKSHVPRPVDHLTLSRTIRSNQALRCDGTGGALLVSAGVVRLGHEALPMILDAVRDEGAYGAEHDPAGDHSAGITDWQGERFAWRIVSLDLHPLPGDADPPSPTRVLAVLLEDEG